MNGVVDTGSGEGIPNERSGQHRVGGGYSEWAEWSAPGRGRVLQMSGVVGTGSGEGTRNARRGQYEIKTTCSTPIAIE